MSFSALRIDPLPLDDELTDAAHVGPELAHGARAYLATPRGLVWRNPSSEWPLFIVLLPLATRLSLMTNPIFGRLVRDWGHGIRVLGVDADRFVYDFRELLDAHALAGLVDALARLVDAPVEATAPDAAGHPALDVLFDVLARDMLTILDRRRADWRRHLAREHRLVVDRVGADQAPGSRSLFDRRGRFPDFLGQLREALRLEVIDVAFYGRVLRAIDLREDAVEARLASILEGALDPLPLAKLRRTRIGPHLGCYNWLHAEPRVASHRLTFLHKLPLAAQVAADRLVIGTAASRSSGRATRADELALLALARAIDSGQDRAVIVALARVFGVAENLIRTLWRQCPAALGTPPEWQLRQLLLALNEWPERRWPTDADGWLAFKAAAAPVSVAGL